MKDRRFLFTNKSNSTICILQFVFLFKNLYGRMEKRLDIKKAI